MATIIGRWLLNEASSGVDPNLIADNVGGNNVTATFSTGYMTWTSNAQGNGLTWTATSNNYESAKLADITTSGTIGSTLDNVTSASMIIVGDIGANATVSRVVDISDGGAGDFSVQVTTSALTVYWDGSNLTSNRCIYDPPSGLTVIAVIVDTTEAAGADRCKVYYDNVLQTQTTTAIAQNSSLQSVNTAGRKFTLGNFSNGLKNMLGSLYYVELWNGALTSTNVSDAYTALSSTNDADWAVPTGPTLSSLSVVQDTSTTFTASLSTTGTDGTLYWYVSQSATAPSAGDLMSGNLSDAYGSQSVIASGNQDITIISGLDANTAYYVYFYHVSSIAPSTIGQYGPISTYNQTVTFPITGGNSLTGIYWTLFSYDTNYKASALTKLDSGEGETTDGSGNLVLDLNAVTVANNDPLLILWSQTITEPVAGSTDVCVAYAKAVVA